jgi:hypothetical protein
MGNSNLDEHVRTRTEGCVERIIRARGLRVLREILRASMRGPVVINESERADLEVLIDG